MNGFPALGPLALAALLNLWTVGGLLALGTLAALRLTRGATPRARYVVALAAFALAAVAPLALALAPPSLASPSLAPPSPASALAGPAGLLAALPDESAGAGGGAPAGAAVRGLGGDTGLLLSPLVAVLWLAGALLLVVREGAALAGLALRARRADATPAYRPGAGLVSERIFASSPDGGGGSGRGHGWPGRCRLVVGDGGGPMAWGVLRSTVYLPRDLYRRLSEGQLRAVVAHELDHVRWRDPAVLAAIRLVLAVLWPAWPLRLLARAAAAEREAAADRAAVDALGEAGAPGWAETLLAVARCAPATRLPAVGLPGPGLAARVDRLLVPPSRGRWRTVAAGAVVLASLVAAGAVPVSAAAHRWDPARADREGWTWFDRLAGENPEIVVTVVDRRIVDRRIVRHVVARDGPGDEASRGEAP